MMDKMAMLPSKKEVIAQNNIDDDQYYLVAKSGAVFQLK